MENIVQAIGRLICDQKSRPADKCLCKNYSLPLTSAGKIDRRIQRRSALNVLAWPIFYLLLQSYVTEWPGVMCIYGVTRVGAGSLGSSRFLPPLLDTLQVTKPLLVFLSGAWFALHLVDRRTRTAPLTGRVLLLLLAASLLACADAAAELAYLSIPKKEEFLSSGCCTAAFAEYGPTRFVPKSSKRRYIRRRRLSAGPFSRRISNGSCAISSPSSSTI